MAFKNVNFMTNFLTNLICITLILFIFLRSPDEIQFRRQVSPISNLLGNSAPNVVKDRFDMLILILTLLLIVIQIVTSYLSN